MTWVAADIAIAARRFLGVYLAFEWELFTEKQGLEILRTPSLSKHLPSILFNDTIAVASSMSPAELAPFVWHEIGHMILHPGDFRWWERQPQGYLTIAKFERQAWDFACLYPIWPRDDQLFIYPEVVQKLLLTNSPTYTTIT